MPDGQTADIRLDTVTKRFGDVTVIEDLSMRIESGVFYAMLGPSGCGKTTTLRIIGGFEEPSKGTVYLGGEDITGLPPHKRRVNTVFQSYALFPHMTVERNVAFGLERQGVAKDQVRSRTVEALQTVQMESFAKRKPGHLSGGQAQRVALARALVNSPQALLLDEPLGALDLRLRRQLQLELKKIQQDVGITFIHVTHDQEEAMSMADTIAVMNKGRIEQEGSATELYESPQTAFVARFLGISNLLDAELESSHGDVTSARTTDGVQLHVPTDRVGSHSGTAVAVGVRPEKITIKPTNGDIPTGSNALRGKVVLSTFAGVNLQYEVKTASGADITVICQNDEGTADGGIGAGTDVDLIWDAR